MTARRNSIDQTLSYNNCKSYKTALRKISPLEPKSRNSRCDPLVYDTKDATILPLIESKYKQANPSPSGNAVVPVR